MELSMSKNIAKNLVRNIANGTLDKLLAVKILTLFHQTLISTFLGDIRILVLKGELSQELFDDLLS